MLDAYSERIFWTHTCIDYFVLSILEDEVKESDDAALGDAVDVEEVILVDIVYDEVAAKDWEDGWVLSTVSLVNTDSSYVVSNGIIK